MNDGNALVDALLPAPAIVFGSLPPDNRDLDLFVAPQERRPIVDALRERGFVGSGTRWALFQECSAFGVDVLSVAEWFPVPAGEGLIACSVGIEGFERLRRPAPHHSLLILARLLVQGSGKLSEKRRERVQRAVAEDPRAFEAARAESGAWGLEDALVFLERAYDEGAHVSTLDRVRALYRAEATTRPPVANEIRQRLVPSGALIALSGVDGSGKSSHAEALRSALEALGYDVVVWWSKLGRHEALDVISGWPKRVLRRFALRGAAPDAIAQDAEDPWDPAADPARRVRRESRSLTYWWAVVVAAVDALQRRMFIGRAVRRGSVVICDRYTLDSLAHLNYRYGLDRRFRLQSWLIRALAPTPRKSFFLDVAPATALARKQERYSKDEMRTLVGLYRSHCTKARAEWLDGEAPFEELCRRIGADVWSSLE